jgi:MYXO-CTERM domain-containing protein
MTASVVYYKDNTAGSPTLTAKSSGFTDGAQLVTINAAAATGMFFVTLPQTLPTGVCSLPTSIEVRDALGNAAAQSAPMRVTLFSTSTGGTFYADSNCASPIAAINVPMGSARGTFYFKDSLTGMPRLTALSAGLTSASQTETINAAGTAVALGFGTAPVTVEAGQCSGAIIVQTQDATGTAAPIAADLDVTVMLGSTVAKLFSDPTCATAATRATIPSGDYRATFYLMDSIVEPVAVNATATGFTPASQTQNVVCPQTVDGAFCDDNDLCNGRETCKAGACSSGAALACDDMDVCTTDSCSPTLGCVNGVNANCCRAPGIQKNANLVAAVGAPYRFDPSGLPVLLKGTAPIAWSLCASGPSGMHVDATTGIIDWIPTTAGTATICLQASGSCGSDMYSFDVNVAGVAPSMPVAIITLPPTTVSRTAVHANAMTSTPNPAYAYEWDFGDGTPLQYGVDVTHSWARAGGYNVRLSVYDPSGLRGDAAAAIAVTDTTCMNPPSVKIVTDNRRGNDQLMVNFSAMYTGADTSPVYRWSFGDGATAMGASASHMFMPGAYQVQLSVTTSDGCSASDSVTIEVTQNGNLAPHCAVTADPISGIAPLTSKFSAVFGDADGIVSSATWIFSDGVTVDAMRLSGVTYRVIDRPGVLSAVLEVVDDHGTLCRASTQAEASNGSEIFGPQIVSVPALTATCGMPYHYGADDLARATGSRPITWSLGRGTTGKPAGADIDASGKLTWTPAVGKEKSFDERLTIVAQNAAGSVEQDFVVKVDCPTAMTKPCGCSAGGVEIMALLALAALTSRSRRRKS